jgi:hypothetical protein
MQVSPLTGELIPVSKFAEHMRIGLLDPRWREQKEKCVACGAVTLNNLCLLTGNLIREHFCSPITRRY